MTSPITKWDERFLQLSTLVGSWSKDPSTKVGAVIAKDNRIVSLGFNGFPPKIEDKEGWLNNREIKYRYVIHAEMNAILNAPTPVNGCTLYLSPLFPCPNCAKHVVASGISRIVALIDYKSSSPFLSSLKETSLIPSLKETSLILSTAGVKYLWLPLEQ